MRNANLALGSGTLEVRDGSGNQRSGGVERNISLVWHNEYKQNCIARIRSGVLFADVLTGWPQSRTSVHVAYVASEAER